MYIDIVKINWNLFPLQKTSKDCKSEPQTFVSVATSEETKPVVAATTTTQPTTCPVHLFMADVARKELQAKEDFSNSLRELGKVSVSLENLTMILIKANNII